MLLFFPRVILYCLGDTSRKKKGRKQQQTASVMKRERLSFHFSHIFAMSHIKGPTRCVVISVQILIQLSIHIVSLTEPFLQWSVFLLFLKKKKIFLIFSPGNKHKIVKACCKVYNFPDSFVNTWCLSPDYLTCQLNLSIIPTQPTLPSRTSSLPHVLKAHTKCNYL